MLSRYNEDKKPEARRAERALRSVFLTSTSQSLSFALFTLFTLSLIVLLCVPLIFPFGAQGASPTPATSISPTPAPPISPAATTTSASTNTTTSSTTSNTANSNPADAAVTLPTTSGKPARKIYSGWIPYYSVRPSVARTIAYKEMISEVSPFWYSLTSSKTIKNQFTSANPSLNMTEQVNVLKAQGFKILPAITDGTKKLVLYGYLANSSTRKEVVSTITNLVVTNNFDGIDLDLEGFAFVDDSSSWEKTKPVWTQFIIDLSTSLHAQNKLLSVTTPVLFDPASGRKGSYHVYNWAGIAPHIDRLRIMTYDYSVSKPGPIGPLEWTESALKYAISLLPASKVWVGIPGYGRDWITKIGGVCPKNVATLIKPGAKAAVFDSAKGSELAIAYGTTPVFDAVRGEATFTYQKTYNGVDSAGAPVSCTATRVAWFQDKRAFLARAEFISRYRIGGLAQWTLSQASTDSINALQEFARTIAPDEIVASLAQEQLQSKYGATERLSVLFSLKDKSPVENLDVVFQFRRSDIDSWSELSKVKTNKEGLADLDLLVGGSLFYRAITQETWERMASQSSVGLIKVTRSLNISAPTYIKAGAPLEIIAQLTPREGAVSLQVLRAGKWETLDTGPVSELNGGRLFLAYPKSRGFMTFRVTVDASEKYNGAEGEPFTVVIR